MLKSIPIISYRQGGISRLKELEQADVAHQPFYLRRIEQIVAPAGIEYPIQMPELEGGCQIIMTRALSHLKNHPIKIYAEAWLWVHAGRQRPPDGSFSGHSEKLFLELEPAMLQIFAAHEHPASLLVILRALPWIAKNQNPDGSWGNEATKPAATLAVVKALVKIRKDLPGCFVEN